MKNKNEINDKTESTLEISLCALLLESSRRYSVLADAVFVDVFLKTVYRRNVINI